MNTDLGLKQYKAQLSSVAVATPRPEQPGKEGAELLHLTDDLVTEGSWGRNLEAQLRHRPQGVLPTGLLPQVAAFLRTPRATHSGLGPPTSIRKIPHGFANLREAIPQF